MKIPALHEVPYDKGHETECLYDDADHDGRTVCPYHFYRDRTHGKQAPIENGKPKCTLFNVWLDGDHRKCGQCFDACRKQANTPEQEG